MADTSDLYTTVLNLSGVERFFGYLGRHGKKVPADGQVTVFGNLNSQPGWSLRKQQALERDLLASPPKVTILSTPRPIIQDAAPDAPLANPTIAATGASANGGTLAVGYYKFAYTFVSLWGETTKGTSLSAAVQSADASNDRITVTTPAPNSVSNCTAINIYATAMAASSGAVDATTLRKVGQITGGTTTFNVDSIPAIDGTHPHPPATNTTEAPVMQGVGVSDAALGIVDPSWGRYVDPN
jgi:hypothetical protein